jgi:hypothetical protein
MTKVTNPGGMPRGLGSMMKRFSNYWLIYRDPVGTLIQENSHTADQREARRLLADRVIARLETQLATVRAVRDEAQAPSQKPAPVRREHGEVKRAVRKAAQNRRSDRTRKAGRK